MLPGVVGHGFHAVFGVRGEVQECAPDWRCRWRAFPALHSTTCRILILLLPMLHICPVPTYALHTENMYGPKAVNGWAVAFFAYPGTT